MRVKQGTIIVLAVSLFFINNTAIAEDVFSPQSSQPSALMSAMVKTTSSVNTNVLSQLALTNRQQLILGQALYNVNNGQIPKGYSSWSQYANAVFNGLSLSKKQLNVLMDAVNDGQIPDGYNSWEDYGQYVMNNPKELYSLLSSIPASSISSMYQKAQNALLTMPVAVQAGGYLNQLNSYDQAFQNADMQMMLPYKARVAYKYANKIGVIENTEQLPKKNGLSTSYSYSELPGTNNGIWVRPYVSTGSINFKNGPKVDNTMYGVFIGGDSSMKHLKHSDFQYSAYVGYNGSHQSYGDNSIYSNGGMLGLTGSWYGEKAFASLTVNAGASNSEISTFYTDRNYPIFSTGIATKTGYNFEFADGKFVIQPSYMMSYSFITPFSDGSVAGIDIHSKPLNAINISPGIKFIGNLNHGWQPYAEARMVWNILDKTDYSTAYIDIPSISIKPYAQYGVGVQKLWGDRLTGFLQFMMRSGGRNDVAFCAGLRFALGKEKL